MKKNVKIFIVGHGNFGKHITKVLEKKFSDVFYISSEDEAIKALNQLPNIIILDENVRFTKGVEIRHYSDKLENHLIHMIYLTRKNKFKNAVRACKLGAIDFIIKDSYAAVGSVMAINRIVAITKDFSINFDRVKYRKSSSFKPLPLLLMKIMRI